MIDWGDDQEFLKRYRLVGATELAKSYGTHRQAIYNHYHYITKYKAQLPNGRVVPKERDFPYLEYLGIILEDMKHDAKTHGMGSEIQSLGFRAWLGTKNGKCHLNSFKLASEGGTQKADYEFGEGM